MDYLALATDYDGTLATGGQVAASTVTALKRFIDAGGTAILVTGRELPDLKSVFPQLELFQRVVAENGALLYRPESEEEILLCEPPNAELVSQLRERGVPVSVGRSVVATVEPHHTAVLEFIHELGLELQVVFNKGSVMVLPTGVNKATGLMQALKELAIKPEQVVAVGDGENDHALLAACGFGVAVANAVTPLKQRADLVTSSADGAGVAELISRVLAGDLAQLPRRK